MKDPLLVIGQSFLSAVSSCMDPSRGRVPGPSSPPWLVKQDPMGIANMALGDVKPAADSYDLETIRALLSLFTSTYAPTPQYVSTISALVCKTSQSTHLQTVL